MEALPEWRSMQEDISELSFSGGERSKYANWLSTRSWLRQAASPDGDAIRKQLPTLRAHLQYLRYSHVSRRVEAAVAAAAVPPSADDELEELAEMVAASSDDEKAASKNIDCQDDVEADGSDTECEDTDDDADPTAEEVRAALLGQQDISKSRPRKRQRQERASAPACLPLGQLLELALQDTYVREMCPATLPSSSLPSSSQTPALIPSATSQNLRRSSPVDGHG
jgi:hypothetical protein